MVSNPLEVKLQQDSNLKVHTGGIGGGTGGGRREW